MDGGGWGAWLADPWEMKFLKWSPFSTHTLVREGEITNSKRKKGIIWIQLGGFEVFKKWDLQGGGPTESHLSDLATAPTPGGGGRWLCCQEWKSLPSYGVLLTSCPPRLARNVVSVSHAAVHTHGPKSVFIWEEIDDRWGLAVLQVRGLPGTGVPRLCRWLVSRKHFRKGALPHAHPGPFGVESPFFFCLFCNYNLDILPLTCVGEAPLSEKERAICLCVHMCVCVCTCTLSREGIYFCLGPQLKIFCVLQSTSL